MYDRRCASCEKVQVDLWEPFDHPEPVCDCGGVLERVRLPTNRGQVIGDECDVWVKHGICNDDGTPRRYTSKKDMREAAEKKGLVNHVEHIPARGSDKSKHTSRWV
jgi:hypothetical protein